MNRNHFSRRLMTLAFAVVAGAVSAAEPAPLSTSVIPELERLYAAWKSAMSSHDLAAWAKTTARSRQMMVRNTIVSQQREWPRALFALAMAPPEVRGLRLAGTRQLGDQARLVYCGRIDFQIDDPRTPPDAVLVIDFVREATGWRFFSSTYFNFRDVPEEVVKVSRGDLSFLERPETALTGRAPDVPRPCTRPDYAGQIRVASFGYLTRVRLGDHHRDTVSGRATTEVIVGGLQRGSTPLVVDVEPIAEVKPEDRSLEIAVYALTPTLKTKASRVFSFQPNNPVSPHHELTVTVGPSTLQRGNEVDLIPSSN